MALTKRAKDILAACLEKETEYKASVKLLEDIKSANSKIKTAWFDKVNELFKELKSCAGEHASYFIEVNGKFYLIKITSQQRTESELPAIITEISITR